MCGVVRTFKCIRFPTAIFDIGHRVHDVLHKYPLWRRKLLLVLNKEFGLSSEYVPAEGDLPTEEGDADFQFVNEAASVEGD